MCHLHKWGISYKPDFGKTIAIIAIVEPILRIFKGIPSPLIAASPARPSLYERVKGRGQNPKMLADGSGTRANKI